MDDIFASIQNFTGSGAEFDEFVSGKDQQQQQRLQQDQEAKNELEYLREHAERKRKEREVEAQEKEKRRIELEKQYEKSKTMKNDYTDPTKYNSYGAKVYPKRNSTTTNNKTVEGEDDQKKEEKKTTPMMNITNKQQPKPKIQQNNSNNNNKPITIIPNSTTKKQQQDDDEESNHLPQVDIEAYQKRMMEQQQQQKQKPKAVTATMKPQQQQQHQTKPHTTTTNNNNKTPLQGCYFQLSGFVNPQRGNIRDALTKLGAVCLGVEDPWTPGQTTHLISAWATTPKFYKVSDAVISKMNQDINTAAAAAQQQNNNNNNNRHPSNPQLKVGAAIVSDKWVYECLKIGGWADERGFEFEECKSGLVPFQIVEFRRRQQQQQQVAVLPVVKKEENHSNNSKNNTVINFPAVRREREEEEEVQQKPNKADKPTSINAKKREVVTIDIDDDDGDDNTQSTMDFNNDGIIDVDLLVGEDQAPPTVKETNSKVKSESKSEEQKELVKDEEVNFDLLLIPPPKNTNKEDDDDSSSPSIFLPASYGNENDNGLFMSQQSSFCDFGNENNNNNTNGNNSVLSLASAVDSAPVQPQQEEKPKQQPTITWQKIENEIFKQLSLGTLPEFSSASSLEEGIKKWKQVCKSILQNGKTLPKTFNEKQRRFLFGDVEILCDRFKSMISSTGGTGKLPSVVVKAILFAISKSITSASSSSNSNAQDNFFYNNNNKNDEGVELLRKIIQDSKRSKIEDLTRSLKTLEQCIDEILNIYQNFIQEFIQ